MLPRAPLDFVILIIIHKKYNLWSSALCSFLQSPFTLSLFGANILVNTLFSDTLSLYKRRSWCDSSCLRLVTYLLTYSLMELNPSWGAADCAATEGRTRRFLFTLIIKIGGAAFLNYDQCKRESSHEAESVPKDLLVMIPVVLFQVSCTWPESCRCE
jgi:hypothetical protein